MNVKIDSSQHQEICDYYKQGATIQQLAERYKVSVGTIHAILKKYKIPKPKRSFSFE